MHFCTKGWDGGKKKKRRKNGSSDFKYDNKGAQWYIFSLPPQPWVTPIQRISKVTTTLTPAVNVLFISLCSHRLVMVDRGSGGFGFNLSGNAPVVIRSVDPASPAMGAKLKSGDHILEINGHNVRYSSGGMAILSPHQPLSPPGRSATHSQVVQLLKTSGSSPSLLVAASNGAGSSSRRASLLSTTSSQRSGTSSARLHSAAFKDKVH